MYIETIKLGPWRRGIVVIESASRTEDTGFESRQYVMFLGLYVNITILFLNLATVPEAEYLQHEFAP
jgi:hypothetical protein